MNTVAKATVLALGFGRSGSHLYVGIPPSSAFTAGTGDDGFGSQAASCRGRSKVHFFANSGSVT